jgi:hypothetical protein
VKSAAGLRNGRRGSRRLFELHPSGPTARASRRRRASLRRIALALALSLPCLVAVPHDAFCENRSLEEILDGFEEKEPVQSEKPEAAAEVAPRSWDLDGSLSVASAINYLGHRSATGTDYNDVQRLLARLDLELDVDLPRGWKVRLAGYAFYDFAYLLHDREDYTSPVLDAYEWEIDTRDAYVQGRLLDNLDIKAGRQVVNWGRSESLRVVDVLNPLDLRIPGLVDIEDMLLPVGMIRLDYYVGPWSLSAIAIPEVRFDHLPPVGSDFNPFADRGPASDAPSESFDNTGWAGSLAGIFHGWDLSFHVARYWEGQPHLAVRPSTPPGVVRDHNRVTMVGSGGNYTSGNWLLKGELAWLSGVDYTVGLEVDGSQVPVGTQETSRVDVMGGVEYYGFVDKTLVFEMVNRHIDDFEDDMRSFNAQENALATSARLTANFFNDRLHVILLAVVFGERAQDGSLVRLSADYDLRDGLGVGGGMLLYQRGDLVEFSEIGSNDRIFLEVRYDF